MTHPARRRLFGGVRGPQHSRLGQNLPIPLLNALEVLSQPISLNKIAWHSLEGAFALLNPKLLSVVEGCHRNGVCRLSVWCNM